MLRTNFPIIGSPQNFTFYYSESPIDEVWNRLLLFSDAPTLKSYAKKLPKDLIPYVTTSLKQAYEYYLASKNVSLNTRPLLLYYSVLNLTKAILTIRNDKTPPSSHGLRTINVFKNIFRCELKMTNGVFLELAKIQGLSEKIGTFYTLEDFLMNCIELAAEVALHFQKVPTIMGVEISRFINGRIEFLIGEPWTTAYPKIQSILSKKPEFLEDFIIEKKEGNNITFTNKEKIPEGDENMKKYGNPLINKHFIFPLQSGMDSVGFINLSKKGEITQPCCYFGMIFLLGSVVRYYPDTLSTWLNNQRYSKKWLIDNICNFTQRIFPNYLLNILYNNVLKFGAGF